MLIKDEIHGTIEFSEQERRIIDSPEFQRLRRIKQMAFTYLVYPGATHTRFEHSLGTVYLSSLICDKLGFDKDQKSKIRLYALVHDLGHICFSHESERVLAPLLGDHEKIGEKKILESEIGDIISENFSTKEIISMSKTPEGKIITSDLGADRMDYLKRDSHNTGVAYGVIDSDRIIHMLSVADGELVIDEGALEAAESFLIARFMMFSTVYFHHTVRITSAMLAKAFSLALGGVGASEFLQLGDEEALLKLKSSKPAKKYIDALLMRRLYKRVYEPDMGISKNKAEELERELSKRFKCDFIVDCPSPFYKPISLKVKTPDGLIDITELSELVKSLKTNEDKRRKALILCEPDYIDKIRPDIEKFLASLKTKKDKIS